LLPLSLLNLCPPPRSTLFPYTTLFRSPPADRAAHRFARRNSSRSSGLLGRDARGRSRLASKQSAQLTRRAKQVDAHGRFVQSGYGADFTRSAVAVVTQHEHRSLSTLEPIDRRRHARPPLAREQPCFGVGGGCTGTRGPQLVGAGGLGIRHEPTIAARPHLAPIEAAVDEDSREPDLERPR